MPIIEEHAKAVRHRLLERGAKAAITHVDGNHTVDFRGQATVTVRKQGVDWRIALWDPVTDHPGKDRMDEDMGNTYISFNICKTPEETAAGVADRSLWLISRRLEEIDAMREAA